MDVGGRVALAALYAGGTTARTGVREPDLNAVARRVLLDALEATIPFRRNLIVVGAQAVYLRTAGARSALQAFTTDADLLLDPSSLPTTPALELVLAAAGFERSPQPGSWRRIVPFRDGEVGVDVDFMVPEAVAKGAGRRAVDLRGHDRLSTRRVHGLEAALIDHSPMLIESLEPADHRSVTVEVAGPAALLIAKTHKIAERVVSGRHERTPVDKDAADVYRLLQTTTVDNMARGIRTAFDYDISRPVAEKAIELAVRLFGHPTGDGVAMAKRAIGIAGERESVVGAIMVAYITALTAALEGKA